jgi:hypothetical protein
MWWTLSGVVRVLSYFWHISSFNDVTDKHWRPDFCYLSN